MDWGHRLGGRVRYWALWSLVAVGWANTGSVAGAQSRRATRPQMAVVVEAGGSLAMASRIRQLLAKDAGIAVESLESFVARGRRPDLVVTVTVARARDIHVMYWDRLGVADSLEAPAPKSSATTGIVAASLAAALVRRNLPALTAALAADPVYPHYGGRGRARSELSALSPAQLRLFLSRLAERSPRTDRLTVADF